MEGCLPELLRLKERLKNNTGEQKLTLGMMLEPNYPLVSAILEGTLKWQEEIDKRIAGILSKEWTRERMSPILIAILQCSIFELFFYKDNLLMHNLINYPAEFAKAFLLT